MKTRQSATQRDPTPTTEAEKDNWLQTGDSTVCLQPLMCFICLFHQQCCATRTDKADKTANKDIQCLCVTRLKS